MSIRDKIRDDLYGSEADDRKSEAAASALNEFADAADRPFQAQLRLGAAVLIEALCIGAILVFPRQVYMIGVAALAYVAMAVFAVGAGGSGIAVTIDSNRTISINYSGMQPETQTNPIGQTVQVQSWSGTADGHIATKGGAILIKSVDDSNIQRSLTVYGRTTTNPLKTLGPMLIPQPYLTSYSCSDNHLSITLSAAGAFLNKFELDRQ